MPFFAFDKVTPITGFAALPLRLEQSASRSHALARLSLLLPAGLAVSVPLALLGWHVAHEPNLIELLASRPVAAAQVAMGIALWMILFVLPALRAFHSLWSQRQVEIADGRVNVSEQGLFGSSTWSAPITSYRGIAHHVRSTLSGVRHEIVLVHPDAARCVTLQVAERVNEQTVQDITALLALPEVPARLLYERTRRTLAPAPAPIAQHAAA